MDKRIKPYHEIYVNCYLNNFISVLSSINTSYKQLLNINNYVYNSYRNLQTNNQALRIRYDLDIYLEAFNKLFGYLPNCKTLQDFLYGDISFGTSLEAKLSNDIMRNLKSLLKDEGVIVFLAQDLFYLIQSNEMYYHKKYLTHYSMFVDYNEGTHCFMVFEMGARGYNCYHVPEENVVQSFSHAVDHPKCFYIKTPQKLDDYTLKTTNFKKYVPEIITSIDSVQYTDALWKIPASADDYLSYIEGVSKIVNRQE